MKRKRQLGRRTTPNKALKLSSKFGKALLYASRLHGGKLRKKTRIPDIGHILGVTAIALEYGATEAEAIAALLHDAVEDAGGLKRLRDIRRRFGDGVAKIVEGCTDTQAEPKPPWLERKKQYVRHVRTASSSIQLVSASDKLQNVGSLLRNFREQGNELWKRYESGKQGALWYYRALVNAFRRKRVRPLIEELDRSVTELERLANRGVKVLRAPGRH